MHKVVIMMYHVLPYALHISSTSITQRSIMMIHVSTKAASYGIAVHALHTHWRTITHIPTRIRRPHIHPHPQHTHLDIRTRISTS